MIYLDHNATTPLDPRVLEAMLPWLQGKWGNASSRDHAFGWDAREAVEDARAQIAELLHAGPHEIIFTSGATESAAICLLGLTDGSSSGLVLSAVEHESVRGPARALAKRGTRVRETGVDADGRLDLQALERLLEVETPALLCIMAANNETGVLFPIKACAEISHNHGAKLFTDATQALGKVPLDLPALGADFASVSAHKVYGPKGAGALFLRGGPAAAGLESLTGGGQEGGLRAGTLNVAAIVGFGEACKLAASGMEKEASRLRTLRDRLEASLMARIPGIRANGAKADRLPNTSNLMFPGADARQLIRSMHDIAVSTRSACSSGSADPSHVLTAMGLSPGDAFASIRFSLGRTTQESDIDAAVEKAAEAYACLHAQAP